MIISCFFALATGACGALSAFAFVRLIYGSIEARQTDLFAENRNPAGEGIVADSANEGRPADVELPALDSVHDPNGNNAWGGIVADSANDGRPAAVEVPALDSVHDPDGNDARHAND